jgi:hypothetical protein
VPAPSPCPVWCVSLILILPLILTMTVSLSPRTPPKDSQVSRLGRSLAANADSLKQVMR